MFSNFFLKSFRILLLPFALLYWLIIGIRNWMYDKKIFRSTSFALPVVCIGNLSWGGTGKSPMVEYLIDLLNQPYRVATLSRGYKRKTKGYAAANEHSTALEIGDEPMQFHLKYPGVPVTVGERRIEVIPQLLHDFPDTAVIILDDAFQHRALKAGLNIVLTEYGNLFTRDFYLPTGDLRDLRSSYKRAQVIVVTKCDPAMKEEEKRRITNEIHPLPDQAVFFSAIKYGEPYHIKDRRTEIINEEKEVLLVTGIANPKPLQNLLEDNCGGYTMLSFRDHHIFTIDDVQEIRKKFETIDHPNKMIITTEKDAVRLMKFNDRINDLPLYVLPVTHQFLFNDAPVFEKIIRNFIEGFKKHVNENNGKEEFKKEKGKDETFVAKNI
jgi:tetraacyldisaccharide 4'-kinase